MRCRRVRRQAPRPNLGRPRPHGRLRDHRTRTTTAGAQCEPRAHIGSEARPMTFATPLLLLLLPALAAAFAWRWLRRPAAARPALAVADLSALVAARGSRPGWRVRFHWLPNVLRAVAIALFVVALARPQRGL